MGEALIGCLTSFFYWQDQQGKEQITEKIRQAEKEGWQERLWAKDPSLWSEDPSMQERIRRRLGWLNAPEDFLSRIEEIQRFCQEVREEGFTHTVLLGMGGSSLCPEVCRQVYGVQEGFLNLAILDSTDPLWVQKIAEESDPHRTLYLVSTKSGDTIETLSFYRLFWSMLRKGQHFVAITDPDTPLAHLAQDQNFRRTFLNPPDIGGRYSALSYFGLVPAGLLGLDLENYLAKACRAMEHWGPDTPLLKNPAILLGIVIGCLALLGRDKLTFITSPRLHPFGLWVEQLIAESTGKQGKGILPVVQEPWASVDRYHSDRVFVVMRLAGEDIAKGEETLQLLLQAGHPVLQFQLQEVLDLGAEFLRWEIATAIAGAVLGINPFDEPNVQESKDNTSRVLQEYKQKGSLPLGSPQVIEEGIALFYNNLLAEKIHPQISEKNTKNLLKTLLSPQNPQDYVALLAYLPPLPEVEETLQRLRHFILEEYSVATTLGYGPRYLHSTGQLHKGGPDKGIFLMITTDHPFDLTIPGQFYSFGVLEDAQALGDYEALQRHGRRVLRIHLPQPLQRSLEKLCSLFKG